MLAMKPRDETLQSLQFSGLYGLLTGAAMFKSYKSFGSMVGAWTVLSLFVTVSFALSVGGFFFFVCFLSLFSFDIEDDRLTINGISDGRSTYIY